VTSQLASFAKLQQKKVFKLQTLLLMFLEGKLKTKRIQSSANNTKSFTQLLPEQLGFLPVPIRNTENQSEKNP